MGTSESFNLAGDWYKTGDIVEFKDEKDERRKNLYLNPELAWKGKLQNKAKVMSVFSENSKFQEFKEVPKNKQQLDLFDSEYDTKKSEISAMNKISQIEEYENRPHTLITKIKTTNADGKEIYGPETESATRHINMVNHWTSNPNDDVDPSFVSLTAD